MAESFEKKDGTEEKRRESLMWIQDYANIVQRLGVLLNRAKDDAALFQTDLAAHPEWCQTITEYFPDLEAGLREAFPREIEEMNLLVERIKKENDPATIKREVNKLLLIIYPKKGPGQWFKEKEFSAEDFV